ncbi:peptidylprolyl isomerase [Fibrobacter sp. UWR2]|uniref:peptidylprolyl isomerase n=1 Tax=Fibrobacter sp. UWR2 TaxID=1964352 RepID=UPI000B521E57|nr:peptidylprolyl isomerase [Fibrobacter sp. UWR2]OWU99154.1 peptidylprolyl isomerase [Fibrobacter sp. UWR2]
MLTWINEKAKWIIVIFAAGIVVGLLAMDRVPKTAQSYPVGVVNDHKISYAEFDSRFKMIQQNQFQGQHLEDEQYSQLRNDIFRSFVRQILLDEQFEKAGLAASVAELKAEFKNNFQAVRGRVVQEAQYRLNAIQQQATSQEDLMQRSQAYIASLPKFITDTTATQEDYEAWLETPEAFKWGMMLQLEEEMKNTNIPMHQLQTLVSAGIHPTTLEAKWNVERRMTEFDLDVAFASASDFAVAEDVVDTAMVKGYFNAHLDSFFVENDAAKFQYVSIPVAATAADDERVREYAMTIYFQLADTSSTATFEEMARISSEDPGSAENGGILSQPAGLGVYVPEFEKAALALDSGAVSEPVKSQFGYHIIKSFGKSTDSTGKVTANVGHILLVVNASSETVDSLEKILTGIKNEVAAGKEFAAAAKERNLEVAESGWVGRNENIPELGYLKGLTSFAWPNENLPEEEGNVSPVLRNSKFVVLANKVKELKAGDRDFDMYFESIKTALKTKKSANAAGIYLNSVADKVKEWKAPAEGDSTATPVAIEKVLVQNMKSSAEGYVNGFGYSSTGLYKVLNGQKVGEWGPVIETDLGAVMVRVNSKTPAEEAAVAAAVKQEYDNGARFFASALFNDFVSKIEKSTPVESNLDLFYRD